MAKNQLGYDMIPSSVRKKLFGTSCGKPIDGSTLQYLRSTLKSFGFNLPPKSTTHDFPSDLVLPDLQGDNIQQHFEAIASQQLGDVPERANRYAKSELPPMPPIDKYVFQPGWTRYHFGGMGWEVTSVPYPLEDIFTFDTETFVTKGSYPIIGTAVSSEACYIWLADEFIDPSVPEEDWVASGMVPVGTDRMIIAHNASYDRVRTQEAYTLETGLENYWFDTLSAHIACCGLASGQRWLYVLSNKDPELLTPEEKKRLRFRPKWLGKGATNSLVEVYNFHVYQTQLWDSPEKAKPMQLADKKIRDVFVKAKSLDEFQPMLVDLVHYALKDSWLTAELFQYLYPRYIDSTPSAVALMGHFYLAGSRVPLTKNWPEWVNNCERVFQDRVAEMSGIARTLLDKEVAEWRKAYDKDVSGMKAKDIKALLKEQGIDGFPSIKEWALNDPWRKQVDWLPKIIGNSRKFPEWKGKALPSWCSYLVMDADSDIGVKSRAAHLLLKLRWKGSPIQNTDDAGWCYWDNELNCLERVPHPQRPGENVGCLLGKDFVKAGQNGILSSDLPEAKRALLIANEISYWTSVRKRVFDRYARRVKNPYGADCYLTLPEILPHGTSTRRVVEPLFATMCSTKSFRIGTELKTRIEAPEGWAIVGGDFDSEEVRIAAGYADHWEGKVIGGSPLGYQLLSGSKSAGTDSHTKISREAFPEFYSGVIFDEELGMCEEVD